MKVPSQIRSLGDVDFFDLLAITTPASTFDRFASSTQG